MRRQGAQLVGHTRTIPAFGDDFVKPADAATTAIRTPDHLTRPYAVNQNFWKPPHPMEMRNNDLKALNYYILEAVVHEKKWRKMDEDGKCTICWMNPSGFFLYDPR